MPPSRPEYPEFVRNADFYVDEHGYSQIGEHLEWISDSDPYGFRAIHRQIAGLCMVDLVEAVRGRTIHRPTPNVHVLPVRCGARSYRLFFFVVSCRGFPEMIFTHCEVRADWGDDLDGVLSFEAERMRRGWMQRNCG